MDFKVLTSIPILPSPRLGKQKFFTIGTHNGIFHSDEVVAIAILYLLHTDENIIIVRTRDSEILKKCTTCVDIGGGIYDHHQPGFNSARKNSIPYASAGLVWHTLGQKLVDDIALEIFGKMFNSSTLSTISTEAWKKIDADIISIVDAEDNGIDKGEHCFSYISSFLPSWHLSKTNFEESFSNVLDLTIKILKQKIIQTLGNTSANTLLFSRWLEQDSIEELENGKCTFANNILHIPCQTIPWIETVTKINDSILHPVPKKDFIYFVIFPYPAGGWAAQCVPPSLEKKFEQRIPFPKDWAGQTDKLPKISGVPTAAFCHNGCFFARAKTKTDIIKMCTIAIQNYKK